MQKPKTIEEIALAHQLSLEELKLIKEILGV